MSNDLEQAVADEVGPLIAEALQQWTKDCDRLAHRDGDSLMSTAYFAAQKVAPAALERIAREESVGSPFADERRALLALRVARAKIVDLGHATEPVPLTGVDGHDIPSTMAACAECHWHGPVTEADDHTRRTAEKALDELRGATV